MPLEKKCPTCSRRMLRLYMRKREGYSDCRSKFYGIVWMCPDFHMIINDAGTVFVPQTTD
jgi:hypothetical protein